MKWWVGLLALLLVALFAAVGTLYVRAFVVHRAHGVILIVANGLDLSLLNKARQQAAARGQPMNIDTLDQLCMLNVEGLGQPVPDEAAASTALACGQRVRNGLVGMTAEGMRLNSLIYAAQRAGRATGLVTTRELTSPTPLAFYGRSRGEPGVEQRSAAELIDSSGIDVILGGGARHFTPANVLNEGGRTDGRDLAAEAANGGFTVVRSAADLNRVPSWRTGHRMTPSLFGRFLGRNTFAPSLLGLFAPEEFTFSALRQGASTEPSLSDMTRMAVKCLQYNPGGYFLVIEHGLIEDAARRNWTDLALGEVAALDAAIGTARAYAGDGSLVVVTSNFSLGALDTTYEATGTESPSAPPGAVPVAAAYEWLAGPGGAPRTADDKAWLQAETAQGAFAPSGPLHPAPAARFSRRAGVTSAPAWLGAGGYNADRFGGFLSNDQVFGVIQGLF